jgi:hypothetical protein
MSAPASAASLEQQMGQVNAERAQLVTARPAGWEARYAELNSQLTALAGRWQEAYEREQVTGEDNPR